MTINSEKQATEQEKKSKGSTGLVNSGGRIEKINSTGIVARTTQTTSANHQLAVATEQCHHGSTRLSYDVLILGVVMTVRQYSVMYRSLQKIECSVGVTVKLFSVMMLKTMKTNKKLPNKNQSIRQTIEGFPRSIWVTQNTES